MIVTVTTNPALDRSVLLEGTLRVGEVQGATSAREDAGGKGINVARVVAAAGHSTIAVLPLNEHDPFAAALRGARLPMRTVPVRGPVRENLTIADPGGVTTKINLPGAELSPAEADAVTDAVVETAGGADWLVLAGSLAPGLPADYYVRVIHAVRRRWARQAPRIAVDTSGDALRAVVAEGAPNLIKPNEDELADLVGVDLDPRVPLVSSVREMSRGLIPSRVESALVTLGAEGAVLITADGAWHGTPPPTRVRSTVGAGDSSLAGFLLAAASRATPDECLRAGIRYGSAAAALPGTQAPTPSDLPTGDIPVRQLHP